MTSPKHEAKPRVLINRYKIVKKVGKGAFGTVYLVDDMQSSEEKQKVLKEIQVGDMDPDETLDAVHEAKLLRKLRHSAILKFFNCFVDLPSFCIVTEFCDGGDLDQCISRLRDNQRDLPVGTAVRWFVEIVMGVDYLHSRRVLHRDLKTKNIFLKEGAVKIGDFGISRVLMSSADMASTFLGTPYFMSPELLKHEGYNAKSDMWSVGCILYEMCALKHAFTGSGLMGILFSICDSECPQLPAKYPNELQELLQMLLQKDPEHRASARDVLKHQFVQNYLRELKSAAAANRQQSQLLLEETVNESANKELYSLLQEKPRLASVTANSSAGSFSVSFEEGDDEELTVQEEAEEEERKVTMKAPTPQQRVMTPREKMELRKKQRADARANELRRNAADQFSKNSAIRQKLAQHAFLSTEERERQQQQRRREQTLQQQKFPMPQSESASKSSMTRSLNLNRSPVQFHDSRDALDDDDCDDLVPSHEAALSSPEMADTFYSSTADFESSDSADEEEEEVVVVGQQEMGQYRQQQLLSSKREGMMEEDDEEEEEEEEGEETLKANYVAELNRALGQSGSTSSLTRRSSSSSVRNDKAVRGGSKAEDRSSFHQETDEATLSIFGPGGRQQKIDVLRQKCEDRQRQQQFPFDEVYKFLNDNATMPDSKKLRAVQQITDDIEGVFLVEQLLWCEKV